MTRIESIFFESSRNHLGSSHLGSQPGDWPTDPTIPDSGLNDPTTDPNWPYDSSAWSTLYHNDPMQILMEQLTYIDAHPTDTKAFAIFAKTVSRLSARGLLTDSDQNFLNSANPINLMKDGIDQNVMYAFLYGYSASGQTPDPSTAGSWDAVQNYVSKLQAALQGIPNSNSYIQGMISETQLILGQTPPPSGEEPFKDQFMKSHSAGYGGNPLPAGDAWGNPINKGDIIWSYTDPNTGKIVYYDWTTAQADLAKTPPDHADQDNTTLATIKNMIGNSSGAAGVLNPDIPYLDSVIQRMQVIDALDTFFSILKQTGDIGMAILAFIFALEGDQMNKLSGNADVMDKQHKLSSQAKAIEDFLRTCTGPNPPSASQLRGMIQSLFTNIGSSNQFAALQSAVATAVSTFQSATLVDQATGKSSDLWTMMTDPTVTNDDLTKSLAAALATPPSTGAPSGNPTQFLQSLLGGVDGVVTAVTSASTQANTIASQLQSLIQALDKVMTGVIDPNNGMDAAVSKTAINHQTQ